jgi:hypothetical protein
MDSELAHIVGLRYTLLMLNLIFMNDFLGWPAEAILHLRKLQLSVTLQLAESLFLWINLR